MKQRAPHYGIPNSLDVHGGYASYTRVEESCGDISWRKATCTRVCMWYATLCNKRKRNKWVCIVYISAVFAWNNHKTGNTGSRHMRADYKFPLISVGAHGQRGQHSGENKVTHSAAWGTSGKQPLLLELGEPWAESKKKEMMQLLWSFQWEEHGSKEAERSHCWRLWLSSVKMAALSYGMRTQKNISSKSQQLHPREDLPQLRHQTFILVHVTRRSAARPHR